MTSSEPRYRLSKSRFMAGWQCPTYLWWKVHEPGAEELKPGAGLQDIFDQGTEVGMEARRLFPGGVLIDLPHNDPQRVARTRAALDAGAPAIFEATFVEDDVFVAVDILAREDDGFTLIEVKSSTECKDEHLPDAAVQTHVLRRAGVDVRRVEIMHLSKAYRFPGGMDLFVREDVTARVQALLPAMPDMIAEQLAAIRGPLPEAAIGARCTDPRACPFWDRCWPQDPFHVIRLYRGRPKGLTLMKSGVASMAQIPAAQKLTDIQLRQKRSAEQGGLVVERGLAAALAPFSGRLGFLDFETISRALPVWPGLSPWRATTVQFSYHETQDGGGYRHRAYLAEGPADPREELSVRMLEATKDAERIVMYSSFERTRIRELAEALPALRGDLLALEAKLIDLLPILQGYVYHPAFDGSFSLKHVLNPLVPSLTYEDLIIQDGLVASVEIWRLLFVAHKIAPEKRVQLRADLLAYCERDTEAMVKLLERLRELAAG